MEKLTYICDNKRHLTCLPYNIDNLHKMADDLGIKRHWFHKDHYDIPMEMIYKIKSKCSVVNTRTIVAICRK